MCRWASQVGSRTLHDVRGTLGSVAVLQECLQTIRRHLAHLASVSGTHTRCGSMSQAHAGVAPTAPTRPRTDASQTPASHATPAWACQVRLHSSIKNCGNSPTWNCCQTRLSSLAGSSSHCTCRACACCSKQPPKRLGSRLDPPEKPGRLHPVAIGPVAAHVCTIHSLQHLKSEGALPAISERRTDDACPASNPGSPRHRTKLCCSFHWIIHVWVCDLGVQCFEFFR